VAAGEQLMEAEAAQVPPCDACGGGNWRLHFTGLTDRIHGAPGSFTLWRCVECGTLRLWPVPADMSPFYPDTYIAFDRAGTRHGPARAVGLRFAWRQAFRKTIWVRRRSRWVLRRHNVASELLEYASSPTLSLLDVGCGGGSFVAGARRLGVDGMGIEPSHAGCRVAAQRGVPVHHGTLEDAEVAPASFDVVRFSHVLEHLPSPKTSLSLAFDALRPGGLVVVESPNGGGVMATLLGRDWYPLDAPRHLWLFNRESLHMLLQDAGFQVSCMTTRSWGGHLFKSLRYAMESIGSATIPADASGGLPEGFSGVSAYLDACGQGDALLAWARKPACA